MYISGGNTVGKTVDFIRAILGAWWKEMAIRGACASILILSPLVVVIVVVVVSFA